MSSVGNSAFPSLRVRYTFLFCLGGLVITIGAGVVERTIFVQLLLLRNIKVLLTDKGKLR
jgi:hypothetical protein